MAIGVRQVSKIHKRRGRLKHLCIVFAGVAYVYCNVVLAQDVQRIAAIVNDEIISIYDLENRIRLVVTTANLPPRQDVFRRLRPQVLRTMIDERIQLQEAASLNIRVKQREINRTISNLARQNRMKPDQLWALLDSRQVDRSALETQVRARVSWFKLIERKFARQVAVGHEEVEEELDRLRLQRGKPRLRVSEIFLSVDSPDADRSVRQTAERLIQQIVNGANFASIAREFSQSTTAGNGGDLGWITDAELDGEFATTVAAMQPGQVSPPLRTLTGYYIIYLIDRRIPDVSAATANIQYRQMIFPILPNALASEVEAQNAQALEIARTVKSCDEFLQSGRAANALQVERLQTVSSVQLSGQIKDFLMEQEIGIPSAPMRASNGISMMVVCRRIAQDAGLPGPHELENKIRRQRVGLLAQRYMRDLRRSAYLDLRQ